MTRLCPLLITVLENATAQLLTVPPYAVAAVVLTSAAWYTDRIQSRGIILAISSLIGSIGYLYGFYQPLVCTN
jgi:hypothetical protein